MTRFPIAAAVLALVPGCNDDTIVDDPVGETQDQGFARGTVLADQAAAELGGDDLAIVIGKTASILAVLNDGQIDQASFAVQVVGAGDIFDFANALIIDHDDANGALDAVVRFYGVPFVPSVAAESLAAQYGAGLGSLRTTPQHDIDFRFIELQVINHAEAEVLLDELFLQVGPGAMGDYILNTRDLEALHLDEASALLATFF